MEETNNVLDVIHGGAIIRLGDRLVSGVDRYYSTDVVI